MSGTEAKAPEHSDPAGDRGDQLGAIDRGRDYPPRASAVPLDLARGDAARHPWVKEAEAPVRAGRAGPDPTLATGAFERHIQRAPG
jgi:hypothetical protein